MEKLRVFLSSTCYDLSKERTILQKHLSDIGHIPILSDKSNIRYDPDKSTHDSCLATVETGTDYMIAIISSRFGGAIFREAFLKHINVDALRSKSDYRKYFDNSKFSISQCEALKALEKGIPCLVFVHKDVLDQRKKYSDAIKAGHTGTAYTIRNPDAVYIFDFITYINNLHKGNGTYEYKSITEVKRIIKDSFSNHFRDILTEKIKNASLKHQKIIPSELPRFNKIIFQKLSEDYKKQKARIAIDNKLSFDNKGNCEYSLIVNIKPINECPVYHIQLRSDKDGDITVKKFRNIDNQKDDSYIGLKSDRTLDLFLFNNSSNLKAPFNIELNLSIENYLSDLVDEGKGQLIKSLHGKNTTYTLIKQRMIFKKNDFKNLQIVCKQHPDQKRINEVLKPSRKGTLLVYDYSVKTNAGYQKKNPAIRFEISRN